MAGSTGVGRGRARAWTPQQEHCLAAWWGLLPDQAVAARLGRTEAACKIRATRFLRQSRKANLLNARQVAALFGVDPATPIRLWHRKGWLWAERSPLGAGGHARMWHFPAESLRRFVAEYPWAYDPNRMRGGHWLTEAARAAHADPWLTTAEAGALVGYVPATVQQWVAWGWLPAERRPRYGTTHGPHGGHIVVRRSDLLALEARLPDQERAHRSAAVRAWQAAKRGAVAAEYLEAAG